MSGDDPLAIDRLVRLKNEIDAKLAELAQIQGKEEFVREAAFVAEFKALKEKYQFSTDDAFTLLDPARLFAPGLNVADFFNQLKSAPTVTDQTAAHPSPDVPSATLHPDTGRATVGKGRPVMRYRNPLTGEVLETKGTNHKTLRQWKAAHGRDLVESWREA
ncbi:DNA binding protein [Pseudomonas syringae]|uniref:DNA binding protein n=1 Tax=Pseudomonas syringae TaxID=317 RepID=UPI0024A7E2A0|nr:DNA binding protein [Pseudomonas syringae]